MKRTRDSKAGTLCSPVTNWRPLANRLFSGSYSEIRNASSLRFFLLNMGMLCFHAFPVLLFFPPLRPSKTLSKTIVSRTYDLMASIITSFGFLKSRYHIFHNLICLEMSCYKCTKSHLKIDSLNWPKSIRLFLGNSRPRVKRVCRNFTS